MNSKILKNQEKRGIVAFDLDGTLIRGIRHSWTLLWDAVGCDDQESKSCLKAFCAGEIDYKQWVKHDFELLRYHGLTIEKVNRAICDSSCRLVDNFEEALEMLKKNDYVVAIISGGVDVVLRYFVPHPLALFNKVYINRLVWNSDGMLEKIVPTAYDWDHEKKGVLGKCAGLKVLCKKFGVSLNKSFFVGNDDNDLMAMRVAGHKIYFGECMPDKSFDVDGLHFECSNNLMKVAEYVLAQ